MVAATHTHSSATLGTVNVGSRRAESNTEYVDLVVKNAAEAIAKAWQSHSETLLRVGRTEVRLGHNRRVVDAEGRATNDWLV